MLSAGERRSFTANIIIRDPTWRRRDAPGALLIGKQDARVGRDTAGIRADRARHVVRPNAGCRSTMSPARPGARTDVRPGPQSAVTPKSKTATSIGCGSVGAVW